MFGQGGPIICRFERDCDSRAYKSVFCGQGWGRDDGQSLFDIIQAACHHHQGKQCEFPWISSTKKYGSCIRLNQKGCQSSQRLDMDARLRRSLLFTARGLVDGEDYFNYCRSLQVYGPQQFPEKLIPKFALLASRKQPLPIHGDGKLWPACHLGSCMYRCNVLVTVSRAHLHILGHSSIQKFRVAFWDIIKSCLNLSALVLQ